MINQATCKALYNLAVLVRTAQDTWSKNHHVHGCYGAVYLARDLGLIDDAEADRFYDLAENANTHRGGELREAELKKRLAEISTR